MGLPDLAVKESRERVRAAIKNSGFELPVRRITVNMAPADTKKEGAAYDLAIAIGILKATEQIPDTPSFQPLYIGELSLDGSIRPVQGVLPMLLSVSKEQDKVVLPIDNALEASHVKDMQVFGVENLKQLIYALKGETPLSPFETSEETFLEDVIRSLDDFSDIKGQEGVKRALEIAAAGGHNIILL